MELVSIIVPVYKVEQYLYECVDSILAQTYQNIEVILIDDGSPDNCPQICDEYAQLDSRVKVVHKKNGGLSDARNAGLDIAKGQYINFCDSDDIIAPEMINTLVELIKKYDTEISGCESVFYENGKTKMIAHYHKLEEVVINSGLDYFSGFFGFTNDCSVCNKLYQREIIGSHRFEIGKTNEDILFQYEVLRRCRKIVNINFGMYKYRVNETSITHTFNINSLNSFYNAKRLYGSILTDCPQLVDASYNYFIYNALCISNLLINTNNKNNKEYKSILFEIRETLSHTIFNEFRPCCKERVNVKKWLLCVYYFMRLI